MLPSGSTSGHSNHNEDNYPHVLEHSYFTWNTSINNTAWLKHGRNLIHTLPATTCAQGIQTQEIDL